MMDLWSFIPYYVARLCSSLRAESVEATLGSVRYHLDREYLHKSGLVPTSGCLISAEPYTPHCCAGWSNRASTW